MKTVLITGATGDVGTHLARELAGKYKLRLSDRRPIKSKNFVKADIAKMADCLRITKGVDAIVHLGGYSVEGPWEAILSSNIVGCYNVNPKPIDKRRLSIWFSPRDLAQLVCIGIDHPDIKFEIVYGISGNTRAWYDNANAKRLGYRPQDDSEVFAKEILEKERPGSDQIAETHQGGIFCTAEDVPNPAAPKKKGKKKK